ncbi:unnamed protein product [Phyllotreta striolata]|uniref:Uncharacterized protein n=1 Tax=Phyllotreta striolata TaxID=444603 RepID=A0A9N9TXV3_PHYSR|nr:unnamed protein product [Phyllotreta striolata]
MAVVLAQQRHVPRSQKRRARLHHHHPSDRHHNLRLSVFLRVLQPSQIFQRTGCSMDVSLAANNDRNHADRLLHVGVFGYQDAREKMVQLVAEDLQRSLHLPWSSHNDQYYNKHQAPDEHANDERIDRIGSG